ncbi:hypothetical protein AAHA92_12218 [Salvia divinorum]|uniref:DUF4218 domain-containing protein n=1 Tax=Salvia divinorum TaxID=28513 RepID=A0ABD1HM73_SALDI
MSHPADSIAWKTFDKTHPFFASESRNVRLALGTDGFQPFGQTGSQYSLWPVILTPYNLPPWMCMKDPYMFLTVIVPGPKNPKQNIDVFLQPLIAELNDLWVEGISVYDISRKQNFQLSAALMWTISDFPAYSMLSGWSTSGHRACPYCMEDSQAFSLKHGRKTSWFDCHMRFLHMNHRFRRDKKNFQKNRMEHSGPPPILNGEQILDHLDQFGFKRVFDEDAETVNSKLSKILGWRKRSIFWNLPYWKTNLIRHNLDVMHIEKNVFDNIFNTIMDVDGKTKDNANARRDLEVLGIRPELWPRGGKYHKAAFTLEKESRELLLKWLNSLKFPDGYVSNLSRCIDMKKHKLYGMKSHDCHVFMQRLLPIGLRELLPRVVWEPLTELSNFFRDLTATVIREVDMNKYNESIALTLCKLEMIFPPSFFDSMEYPKYDPFVLAQQASQIYFVPFPSKKKDKVNWRAVMKVRAKKFDISYAITKEAEEDTAFQEDEVEDHEISDDIEFVEPSRHDPTGAMIPILREIADDEEEDDDDDDDNDDDEEDDDDDDEEEEE